MPGFFLPGFLLPQRIEEVRDWTQQVIDWPELPGKYMKYYEDEPNASGQRPLNRIENFSPYHTGLRKFCSESELTVSLMELMGEEDRQTNFHNLLIFKFRRN